MLDDIKCIVIYIFSELLRDARQLQKKAEDELKKCKGKKLLRDTTFTLSICLITYQKEF